MIRSLEVPAVKKKQRVSPVRDTSLAIGASCRTGTWVSRQKAHQLIPANMRGRIGYEFEMEGAGLNNFNPPRAFKKVEDGSLRGEACEVVFYHPAATAEDACVHIYNLFEQLRLQGVRLNQSLRTSVHIHFNFMLSSYLNFINFAVVWYIYEELFVKWCGETREGNNFCLRAVDSYRTVQNLINGIKDGIPWINFGNDRRYAAFNYHALSKFGSVEIRSMGGDAGEKKQIQWVTLLNKLYELAHKEGITPSEIVNMFSGYGGYDLLSRVAEVPEEIINQIISDLSIDRDTFDSICYRGVRIAQEIAFCENWEPAKVDENYAGNQVEVILDDGLGLPPVGLLNEPRQNPVQEIQGRPYRPIGREFFVHQPVEEVE